jgi:hypothetical protein
MRCRRVVGGGEWRRVFAIAHHHAPAAATFDGLEFAGDGLRGGNGERAPPAAAAGQLGQGFDGLARRAEPCQKLAEGDRADIFGSRETDPVAPFRFAQRGLRYAGHCGMLRSACVVVNRSHPMNCL